MIKKGDIVTTKFGTGNVIGFEKYRTFKRIIVLMDNPPFDYNPMCFFENEVTKIN